MGTKVLIQFLSSVALAILGKVADSIWEALWLEVIEAIDNVQTALSGESGKVKKAQVVEQALIFLQRRKKLNRLQLIPIKLLLSKTIDALVESLKKDDGRSWKDKVLDLKQKLADKIPYVD